MRNIGLQQMLNKLVISVLENKQPPKFYWKTEDPTTGNIIYKEISEVDLLRDRFKTTDDDFNYYEYELTESNIYIKEE